MPTRANIHEFKAHLSEYTRKVKSGETVILCERNVPIAELRPIGAGIENRIPRPEPGLFAGVILSGAEEFFTADGEIEGDFYAEDSKAGVR